MKALRKDIFRAIRKSLGRFLAIMSIALLGVAFFAGVCASPDVMRSTADSYFDDYRLQDLRLISSIGFTDEEIEEIKKMEGIEGLYPAHSMDVLTTVGTDENLSVSKIYSLPADLSDANESYINRLRLAEGRLPEAADECVVRINNNTTFSLKVGDTLNFSSGTDTDISENMSRTQYTIVGLYYTPFAISYDLGSTSVGNGHVSYMVYLPEENFTSEYYTEVYITLNNTRSVNTFQDVYFDLVDPVSDSLEDLSRDQIALRIDDIKNTIHEEVTKEVTREVTDQVTEEVTKAVREEIEKQTREAVETAVREGIQTQVREAVETAVREGIETQVRSAVETAVRQGIETQVRSAVETAVRQGIESQVRSAVETAVRQGIESQVRSAVETAVRQGIETQTRAAVEAAVRQGIETQTRAAVEAAVRQAIETQTRTAVEAAVREGIQTQTRAAVEAAVRQGIETQTRAAVEAAVREGIQTQTRTAVTAQVTATLQQDPSFAALPQAQQEAMIQAGVEQAYPAALETAMAQNFQTTVEAQYPAALQQALDQNLQSTVDAQYPAALEAAMTQNFQSTVDAQYPAALQQALDQNLQSTVDAQYPAALQQAMSQNFQSTVDAQYPAALQQAMTQNYQTTVNAQYPAALQQALDQNLQSTVNAQYPAALQQAMDQNFQSTVDAQYPAALQQAMDQNYQSTVDAQYPAALETAMNENFQSTVDAEYPSALQTALDENLNKTVEEEYPAALETALAENLQKTVDETVPEEVEKILPETIEEVYNEQLEDNLDGSQDWQWYILDRNSQASYVEYAAAADQMQNIASIFPVFFFFVAVLVCFTTMTRMVDEERGLIGTYKALGYGKVQIASKYITYAMVASLVGGIIGCIFGLVIFPNVICTAWGIAYKMPSPVYPNLAPLCILAISSITIIVTLAALWACYSELFATPAALMRPKAPTIGKKIVLERIPIFWKHLSFTWKVTCRNIFRYKKRFCMTLVGVAGCTALLVTGFGIKDSISGLIEEQYGNILKYDFNVIMKNDSSARNDQDVDFFLDENELVTSALSIYTGTLSANRENSPNPEIADMDVSFMIAQDSEAFYQYISLQDKDTGEEVTPGDDGVIITEKLADELRLSKGDTLYLEGENGQKRPMIVAGVVKMYVGHYAVCSDEYYESVFGSVPQSNTFFGIADLTPDEEALLGEEVLEMDGVSSITFFTSNIQTFTTMISSLNLITVVLIISSGLLAFVVLYNLANVNISERMREIATIKVLGFYDKEVNSYVNRESIIITIIGALVGLPIGVALHHFIMGVIDMSNVMFGEQIKPLTFIYSFALTILFSVIVNHVVNKKLRNIAMVESLKSVE